MWQVDQGLIQIELGTEAVDITAKRYERSLFDKLLGANAPEPAQLLLDKIGELRSIIEEEGFSLPSVKIREESDLNPDVCRIYFGIELTQIHVQSVNDVIAILLRKTRNYFTERASEDKLAKFLAASTEDAKDNDYISAFQKVCLAYYFSVLEGQEIEKNIALGFGGNYSLRNGDFIHAYSYLVAALIGVHSSNVFPAEMSASICLDIGNLLRIWGDREADREQTIIFYKASEEKFQAAIDTAKICNDATRLYFGLCGLAGIRYLFNDFGGAASLIEESIALVSDNIEREHLKDLLYEIVRVDRDRLLSENNQLKAMLRDTEDQLKKQCFVNQVGKIFVQLAIAPSINAALSGMGLMGQQSIKIAGCRFEGSAQIGFKNYSQKLRMV